IMRINAIFTILVSLSISVISCKNQEENTDVTILSVAEAKTILAEDPEAVFLDVRTPEEFRDGHIEGAVLINFFDTNFKQQVASLDKNKPVYIYCRSGNRSEKAGLILTQMGFTEIFDIEEGYMGWE
ncbi:MAG TPA: rhodanese-like domain-containing protein, partial [Gillisia sp.]|nr:rhodanese-like domain-containing protein [Gillisia sp.]